jgi:signal transduction histidine kinase
MKPFLCRILDMLRLLLQTVSNVGVVPAMSRGASRLVRLTNQVALSAIGVAVLIGGYALLVREWVPFIAAVVCCCSCSVAIWLNARQRTTLAKVYMLFINGNVAVAAGVLLTGTEANTTSFLLAAILLIGLVLNNEQDKRTFYTISLLTVVEYIALEPLSYLIPSVAPLHGSTLVMMRLLTNVSVSILMFATTAYFLSLVNTGQAALEQVNTRLAEANSQLHEANEELLKLNQEKNEFLGIAAHDLKNPLNGIRGNAEFLREYGAEMAFEEQKKFITSIVDASDRMFSLIKNLLDVNMLEEEGVAVHLAGINPNALVAHLVEQYQSRAQAKNIRLHPPLEQAGVLVYADEQALMQVLDNLVSNAVKYSPSGTNIFVRVLRTNGTVRFEIQDEGPGISLEDQTKLFGKFARLSAQPTGGEHSTGLGLSIVKKLVEAMSGRVWCESELGKGATFVVELPAKA